MHASNQRENYLFFTEQLNMLFWPKHAQLAGIQTEISPALINMPGAVLVGGVLLQVPVRREVQFELQIHEPEGFWDAKTLRRDFTTLETLHQSFHFCRSPLRWYWRCGARLASLWKNAALSFISQGSSRSERRLTPQPLTLPRPSQLCQIVAPTAVSLNPFLHHMLRFSHRSHVRLLE